MSEIDKELSHDAMLILTWLQSQGLSWAEMLYLLSGLMVLVVEEAYAEADKPQRVMNLEKALDEAGYLFGGVTLLLRAKGTDLRRD